MHPPRSILRRVPTPVFLLAGLLMLAGCGAGGGSDGQVLGAHSVPVGLNQAAYISGTGRYAFGAGGVVPNPAIRGAPADMDSSRWAMLHDGRRYRLYFMRRGDDSTLYQFGYNSATQAYEFGYESSPQIPITGAPDDANPSSIAMLHDGERYRLYMRSRRDPRDLYQFAFDGRTYAFGHASAPKIRTSGAPADADFSRWAMFHDGSVYRQCVARAGTRTVLYQFGFDGSTYAFGHASTDVVTAGPMPDTSDTTSFAMQHGGGEYRFYHLVRR